MPVTGVFEDGSYAMSKLVARMQPVLIAGLLSIVTQSAHSAGDDSHVIKLGIDIGIVAVDSPVDSWTEDGLGKLRFDEDNDGLRLNHAFLDYRGRITDTVNARATLMLNDDLSNRLDIIEAYIEYRPVPDSAWRTRWRFGAFYPHFGMENVDVAWTTPYTLSSSTINSWLAEELRAVGIEGKVGRDIGAQAEHHLSFEGAIIWKNDPTGALLGARGWSIHNRQTGLRGELPLTDSLPNDYEPFEELDHKAGYYFGTEYRYKRRLQIRYHHYDNHGDPEQGPAWSDTWETWFDTLSFQIRGPAKIGIIGQWIEGRTLWQGVDDDFRAWSLLATRAFDNGRFSIRYDDFYVDQSLGGAPATEIDEGDAWTIAYLYNYSQNIRLGAEWVEVESTRPMFAIFGPLDTYDERQLMLSIRYLYSNQH